MDERAGDWPRSRVIGCNGPIPVTLGGEVPLPVTAALTKEAKGPMPLTEPATKGHIREANDQVQKLGRLRAPDATSSFLTADSGKHG